MSTKPLSSVSRFFPYIAPERSLSLITPGILHDSMRGVGSWLDAASAATGKQGGCYRTAIYHEGGEITWLYPNSNTPELIGTWLDLADVLEDDRYREMAVHYGDRLISDPVQGIYRGEQAEGHGMMWYWRDDSTYTGGYSMRAPVAFRRLNLLTGDSRFLEVSEMIGKAFLRRQLPNGFVSMVGWCPKQGWILQSAAGSRYVYPLATFATLYQITSDVAYKEGYERVVESMLKMQKPDGSFCQHYNPETLEVTDSSIKLHFFSYIFNALAEGYAVFQDPRLIEVGRKMAAYLADVFYYRRQIPYCEKSVYASDITEADTAIHDSANGLFWLYEVTKERLYLDLALRLWLQAWSTQADLPDRPGWHGALLRGMNPELPTGIAKGMAAHLLYEPSRIGRCEIWFMANHVMASRRLAELL